MRPIYRHEVIVYPLDWNDHPIDEEFDAATYEIHVEIVCAETVRDARTIAFLLVHGPELATVDKFENVEPESLVELADRLTQHNRTFPAKADPAVLAQRRGDRKS